MKGEKQFDLLALIADDQAMISYRPRWNAISGSVNATSLLQQVIYRWVGNGRQPFYKFSSPCKHKLCRVGDSWQEELGFSRREFETARKKLGGRTRGDIDESHLVSFWRDSANVTWYGLNEGLLLSKLAALYPDRPSAVGVQLGFRMAESANRSDGAIVHSRVAESANRSDGTFVHSRMAQSATGSNGAIVHPRMAQSAIPSYKDNNKEDKGNNKEYPKTTATTAEMEPVDNSVAAAAPDGAYAMLLAAGVVGKPLAQLSKKRPFFVLAWIWTTALEGMERKYVPGFIVNQLRGNTTPPPAIADLAQSWLKLDASDREVLRGLVEGMSPVTERPFSDHVPDGYFRNLYEDSLNAFAQLYRAKAYLTEW